LFGSSEVNRAHSTVFSILQESGIVGLSLWIAALSYAIRIIKKRLQSKNIDTRMFSVCAAYVVILSIFNDIRSIYELTIVVFFIVPVLSVYITENMEKSKNFSLRRKRHAK
jgi:O-antigen ligase